MKTLDPARTQMKLAGLMLALPLAFTASLMGQTNSGSAAPQQPAQPSTTTQQRLRRDSPAFGEAGIEYGGGPERELRRRRLRPTIRTIRRLRKPRAAPTIR